QLERGDTKPMAAVTFDDGYRDVYERAFPLLQRKGIPAAVFVVTDLVGTRHPQICDHLYLVLMQAFARLDGAAVRIARLLEALGMADVAARIGVSPATPLTTTVRLLRSLPRSDVARLI